MIDWTDDQLRAYAKETLGMQRLRDSTLDALSIILGSMAYASSTGVGLKIPVEVDFATPRTMRTLMEKFLSAGLVKVELVSSGPGRPNPAYVYRDHSKKIFWNPELEYTRLQRALESDREEELAPQEHVHDGDWAIPY